ncbi:type II toxin-antitoxin system HicB family antitoxin [Paraburkholderia youngii]|uniref:Type II toxin-antitoxin system HicB family antitoxin n=1 Tax=Paraburkholderia youngii TaxID=2782701 RepID=A0ABX2NPG8_9BURK|nr:type II toxin-antitoxin system HicB family antitoxin [Paraburkholderia youngii]NVI06336.1 type II toxin-antitoxin system HicB family antitoxin [Paraburkholderia youngii]
MLRYPALIEPDGDGFAVSFRDIPEALTGGSTTEEAREMAADALLTAMDFYFEDRRPVPTPSKAKKGEELVALPASVSAKVLLLNEMIEQKVTPAGLARRLGTSPQAVNRIVDIGHSTKIDTIAEALEALGKHLEIAVV